MTEEAVRSWLAELEQEQGLGPDGTHRHVEGTSDAYLTIALCHHKPEGEPAMSFTEPETAWAQWRLAFEEYLERGSARGLSFSEDKSTRRRGRIHWRQRPNLREHRGRFFVVARVFIEEDR